MNDPSSDILDEVDRWMRHAQVDLEAARVALSSEILLAAPACFHAQQAAEKALKAALIAEGVDFPRTHSLGALAALLPENWAEVKSLDGLAALTLWAVESRYPGDWGEATSDDAAHAIMTCEEVLALVRSELVSSGFAESAV